ncbi:Helix-turn-helix domain-containing protein [Anaerosporobacter mobilis DSM 15930]|jgi:two-component system response regulator YesN|uniref:Stage 0 sporulation protein A homolog n=1 Tax=Anaerosporobacter mobilis DSM 15930 TaxID=1120996 RepID=A0A1M7JL13_9FIRM|nr:response regulator [Anaerosporobacter mobilis]SHM53197.1 Helix-turn-helix domain-containing protein [Anaerosporobacter mobilis DSM 15930]
MYKILIADDEQDERNVISYLIKKYNFSLDLRNASNGKEALTILEHEHIDILFTDIQMPFMNGLELAARAKEINPTIEIIFFSGYDDFEYVKQALSLHAVNYILKPVNPEEFYKSINEVCQTISNQKQDYLINYDFTNAYNPSTISSTNLTEKTSSDVEDSMILSNIEQATRLKDPNLLRKNVSFLLKKYEGTQNISHIYIRYLCTTLLRYLLTSLPDHETMHFQACVDKIYTFNQFKEIKEFIESFLEKSLTYMKQEMQAPKYSIHVIKQYINGHYREDISLNQLADLVYLSPKYLSSIFSQTTGISINKYIKNIRMEKARELLVNTNMKIRDIGTTVGYPNISYFCKLFQEEFRISPEKYRNKGQLEE